MSKKTVAIIGDGNHTPTTLASILTEVAAHTEQPVAGPSGEGVLHNYHDRIVKAMQATNASVRDDTSTKETGAEDNSLVRGLENIAFLRQFQVAKSQSLLDMDEVELIKLHQLIVSPYYDLFTNFPTDQELHPILIPDEDAFEHAFPIEAITAYRDGPNNKPLPGGRRSSYRLIRQASAGQSGTRQKDYILGTLIPNCTRRVLDILKSNNLCQDIPAKYGPQKVANATPMELLYVSCKVLENNDFTRTDREIRRTNRCRERAIANLKTAT